MQRKHTIPHRQPHVRSVHRLYQEPTKFQRKRMRNPLAFMKQMGAFVLSLFGAFFRKATGRVKYREGVPPGLSPRRMAKWRRRQRLRNFNWRFRKRMAAKGLMVRALKKARGHMAPQHTKASPVAAVA